MKLFTLAMTVTGVLVLSSMLFYNKQGIACEAAPLLGFEQIDAEIYVDATVSQTERDALITFVDKAKERVSAAFDDMSSTPRYIVTKKSAQFGFNPTGMARSSLTRECIFIGPKGFNVDVIAHETSHAEVFYRANFITQTFKIKPWLLEGAGTYVDYRAALKLENIALDNAIVEKVTMLSDFSPSDTRAYQASRVAFESVDPKTFYKGIERLNEGESFESVFGYTN